MGDWYFCVGGLPNFPLEIFRWEGWQIWMTREKKRNNYFEDALILVWYPWFVDPINNQQPKKPHTKQETFLLKRAWFCGHSKRSTLEKNISKLSQKLSWAGWNKLNWSWFCGHQKVHALETKCWLIELEIYFRNVE